MYRRGEMLLKSDGANQVQVRTPYADMDKKVRKFVAKHYQYHQAGTRDLHRMFSQAGSPLRPDQVDSLAQQAKMLTGRAELEELLGTVPAGFCLGMTTLWCREVAFHHRHPVEVFADTKMDGEMRKKAVEMQETYQAKMFKRIVIKASDEKQELDFVSQPEDHDAFISDTARAGMDKKAGVTGEGIHSGPFPEKRDDFLNEFAPLAQSVQQRDDVYRFSFKFKLGGHAIGFCSCGGRINLMDPNEGVLRYNKSEELSQDLADAFYGEGSPYQVQNPYHNYVLFKFKK